MSRDQGETVREAVAGVTVTVKINIDQAGT